MKKVGVLILILLFIILAFAACDADPTESTYEPTINTTEDVTVSASDDPLFVFTRENFPVMDGSTSTMPLGQAIASVLLGEPRADVVDLAVFNKTTQSFRNLMEGLCDILVVAEPNAAIFDEMEAADFMIEMSAIATDALVFVVNVDNPVSNLTTEQVQKIYTGEITNWNQVGGADMEIEPFQRNADAGSQALMEKLVMNGITMMTPPMEYVIGDMEGLLTAVKGFDGTAQAIGYTVYYYADDMQMADGLKILSIDGVSPNDETIRSGAYPFLNPYYAVIAATESEDSPARIMYEWLLSEEGQALVDREGYVSVMD